MLKYNLKMSYKLWQRGHPGEAPNRDAFTSCSSLIPEYPVSGNTKPCGTRKAVNEYKKPNINKLRTVAWILQKYFHQIEDDKRSWLV
jgi:hypothetical protein